MPRFASFTKPHILLVILLLITQVNTQSVKFATTTDFFISIKPCGRCCFERWDVGICRPFNTVPGPEGCTVNSCLCKDQNIKAAATSHLNSCVDVSCDGDVGVVQNAVSYFDAYCSRYLEGEGEVIITSSSSEPERTTVPGRTTDGPVESTTMETSTTAEETSTEETSTAEETSTTAESSTTEETSTTEEPSTTDDSTTITSSPSPSPTTRFPITTTYSPSPSPNPPPPPDDPGLSVSIKIGLGVGFGIGVPTIAVTIYLCCRFGLFGRFNIAGRIRRRRMKRRKEERSPEQIDGDFIEPIQGDYID